jgi:hypothetical protein
MPAFKNTTKVTQKVREKIKYQGDVAQWILVASKIDKNKQKTIERRISAFLPRRKVMVA